MNQSWFLQNWKFKAYRLAPRSESVYSEILSPPSAPYPSKNTCANRPSPRGPRLCNWRRRHLQALSLSLSRSGMCSCAASTVIAGSMHLARPPLTQGQRGLDLAAAAAVALTRTSTSNPMTLPFFVYIDGRVDTPACAKRFFTLKTRISRGLSILHSII